MCILLKLDYAKFDVSNLYFFKCYQRKTFSFFLEGGGGWGMGVVVDLSSSYGKG